jgi:hypothetical protein
MNSIGFLLMLPRKIGEEIQELKFGCVRYAACWETGCPVCVDRGKLTRKIEWMRFLLRREGGSGILFPIGVELRAGGAGDQVLG